MKRTPLKRIGKRGRAAREAVDAIRKMVYERAYRECERCLDSRGDVLHIHHKLPRSRGGKHTVANCCLLCARCHREVHDHTVSDWREWVVTRKAAK